MEFQELFDKLNDGKLTPPADKKKWEEASDRISVHAKGIRPQFQNPRKGRAGVNGMYQGGLVTPANYEERYQYLFDNYILNRHPNEQEEHYQFRLSVFPALAKEIYLQGKTQVGGSIFQQSQYTIAANDELGQEYLDSIDFTKRVQEQFFEHILTDPFGKFAIVEKHLGEFSSDEKALPDIELVESRHILHYEAKESILFCASEKIDGRKVLYYLDRQYCIKLIQTEQRKKQYVVFAAYEHGLGELPVVDNNKYLFESFVTWADLIGRNFSDDEIVAKNNNHPHIQMVESVCSECIGSKVVNYPCDTCDGGMQEENCRTCKGRGTISVNPGEIHVIKESEFRPGELTGGSGMVDRIKFINPDVSISQNSFERCQKIYEGGLRSLHLKRVDEAQSGVAKALDYQMHGLLVSGTSTHVFSIVDLILRYVFGYLNMGISKEKPYTVEQPTQFQIKTEADIIVEMKDLASADLSTIRDKTDEYNQVVYSGNAVKMKKWEVVKVWDTLYCMSPDQISTYKLMGGVTPMDVIRHVKADFLMSQIILSKGEQHFINTDVKNIVAELDIMVKEFEPTSELTPPAIPV